MPGFGLEGLPNQIRQGVLVLDTPRERLGGETHRICSTYMGASTLQEWYKRTHRQIAAPAKVASSVEGPSDASGSVPHAPRKSPTFRRAQSADALKMLFGVLIALCVSARLALAQSHEFGQCGGEGWTGESVLFAVCPRHRCSSVYDHHIHEHNIQEHDDHQDHRNDLRPSSTSTSTTGLNIRLLPLGDSITYGFTSSDGNGYRATLHNLLQPGNTVDFIGSIESGTMVDNNNEGHIGAIIEQIAGFATNAAALPARPNVVLLMAGTNDVIDGLNATAPAAISSLMDAIFVACPDTALIVATLTPLTTGQAGVDAFNAVLTTMISARAAAGKHILLASMAAILASDLIDGIHPTDAGYVKMADAWFTVVEQAAKNGWIGTPVTV
ncbi:SGNH hydrolase-type esterase domain-containing protein [Mycena sp. CBHHK59/15]|nr:SGNH hydrolase-type esterase domain-containing protein [Mycena sp. CBHHK59/15]